MTKPLIDKLFVVKLF